MLKTTVLKILYITSSNLGAGFIFKRFEYQALLFFFQYGNIYTRPKVTSCIRIDSNLLIQVFYETSLVPLPKWLKNDYYSRNIQNQSTMEHNNIINAFLLITRLLLRLMRFIQPFNAQEDTGVLFH